MLATMFTTWQGHGILLVRLKPGRATAAKLDKLNKEEATMLTQEADRLTGWEPAPGAPKDPNKEKVNQVPGLL